MICFDLDFDPQPNRTSTRSGPIPRLCIGTGKIAEVPIDQLPADLGFRDVNQVLQIAQSDPIAAWYV
jgi:hypothetical protein